MHCKAGYVNGTALRPGVDRKGEDVNDTSLQPACVGRGASMVHHCSRGCMERGGVNSTSLHPGAHGKGGRQVPCKRTGQVGCKGATGGRLHLAANGSWKLRHRVPIHAACSWLEHCAAPTTAGKRAQASCDQHRSVRATHTARCAQCAWRRARRCGGAGKTGACAPRSGHRTKLLEGACASRVQPTVLA